MKPRITDGQVLLDQQSLVIALRCAEIVAGDGFSHDMVVRLCEAGAHFIVDGLSVCPEHALKRRGLKFEDDA